MLGNTTQILKNMLRLIMKIVGGFIKVEKNKKKQLIVGVIAIVLLIIATVGVTYSFFNYTRTGNANTVSVGRIAFNSSQDGRINLTNIFPIDPTETGIMNDATKVGTVAITVTGDTTYDKGVEYLVSAVNVNNTVGTKTIPISISATASGTLGTSDEDYFDNRDTATSHIYKVLAKDTISNNDQLMVGYIAKGATGINGTITIKAYIDKNNIAISDTYNSNGTPTDTNGTTSEWVNGRTVFTTTEWNGLSSTGISFQVKVEANEGIWVEEPLAPGQIASCLECKFLYTTDSLYTTWNNQSHAPTVLSNGFSDSYIDVITATGKNYFLGVNLNGNDEITNIYACGIYNETTPFCIEKDASSAKYDNNSAFLNGSSLWNNTCSVNTNPGNINITCGSFDGSSISASDKQYGRIWVGDSWSNFCFADPDGYVGCF